MPPIASKRTAATVLTLFIVLLGLTLAGCHAENKAKTGATGKVCPVCQTPTRSVPMADLTYTICVCPGCKKVTTFDGATRAEVEAYVGGDIGETVHVCDKCDVIVERCAACGEQ
jgi:hypothetical protein